MNIANIVYSKINKAVENADLIILAVPVGSMGDVAKQIKPFLKKGAIITDTGSTKLSVIRDIESFIPSGVFTDYFGLTNDTIVQGFKTKSVSDYSTVALSISPNFNVLVVS